MGDQPWNANEGKFDTPSSSLPVRREPVRPAHSTMSEVDAERERKALRGIESIRDADEAVAGEIVEEQDYAEELAQAAAGKASARLDAEGVELLTRIVEDWERLNAASADIAARRADLRAYIKLVGFDVKAVRRVVADRTMGEGARKEREAIDDVYRAAFGIEPPEFAVALPRPLEQGPKKIGAREKKTRTVMALIDASRFASGGAAQ